MTQNPNLFIPVVAWTDPATLDYAARRAEPKVIYSLRVSERILKVLDTIAYSNGLSRCEIILRILEQGLDDLCRAGVEHTTRLPRNPITGPAPSAHPGPAAGTAANS